MKNTTRNTLLISVAAAALIVGAGLASAQDNKNEMHGKPAEAAHDQKVPEGKAGQQPSSLPQKSPAPTAQAPMNAAPTAQAPTAQAPMKPAPTAQAPAAPAPTAQAPMKPAASKLETGESGSVSHNSESTKPRTAQSRAVGETKSSAPAALSSEQHVKLRDTVRGEKHERLTDVHFSITVGEIIPGTVHLYRLPVSIVEYAPEYRDYESILVGDDILIVDPNTLRIIAVIAA